MHFLIETYYSVFQTAREYILDHSKIGCGKIKIKKYKAFKRLGVKSAPELLSCAVISFSSLSCPQRPLLKVPCTGSGVKQKQTEI